MRTKWVRGVLLVTMVFGTPAITWAAANDDVSALKQQVAALNAKILELEQKLVDKEKASTAAPAVQAQASPGYGAYNTWDPFAEMDAMERHMQSMMAHPVAPGYGAGLMSMPAMQAQMSAFSPGYDLKETDKAYIVTFDMPGMDKAKINVEVKEGVLYVSGERSSQNEENQSNRFYRQERSFGYFSRAIPLPENAKADTVQAKYDNGVLIVTIDKKESAPKPKANVQKIDVK